MILPNNKTTIETLIAKQEAVDTLDIILKQNKELSDIYDVIQPLLYAVSVKLYGENAETISLTKLVEDGVAFLAGKPEGETLQ